MSRDYRSRETQVWLRTGQMRLSQRIQGEQRLDTLGGNVLEFLAHYLDAQYPAAISAMQKAQPQIGELKDYVAFFIGNSYVASNNPEESLAYLRDFGTRFPDSLYAHDALIAYAKRAHKIRHPTRTEPEPDPDPARLRTPTPRLLRGPSKAPCNPRRSRAIPPSPIGTRAGPGFDRHLWGGEAMTVLNKETPRRLKIRPRSALVSG